MYEFLIHPQVASVYTVCESKFLLKSFSFVKFLFYGEERESVLVPASFSPPFGTTRMRENTLIRKNLQKGITTKNCSYFRLKGLLKVVLCRFRSIIFFLKFWQSSPRPFPKFLPLSYTYFLRLVPWVPSDMSKYPFTSFFKIQFHSKPLRFSPLRDPSGIPPNLTAVVLEFRWRFRGSPVSKNQIFSEVTKWHSGMTNEVKGSVLMWPSIDGNWIRLWRTWVQCIDSYSFKP